MKLSKEDLKRLVWHAQAGLTDCDSLAWLEFIDGILNGRYDEPLEIEDYEKSKWTRLDPNDESTHPKEGTPALFISYNPIDKWGMLADIASKDVIDDWKNISRLFGVVFWREVTFPNPPTEMEVQK